MRLDQVSRSMELRPLRERAKTSSVSRESTRSKLNKLIAEICEERKARTTAVPERCRPRLPSVMIPSVDPVSHKKIMLEVGHLQDYPDRLKAIRELIKLQFGSDLSFVYRKLDINGTGMISVEDLFIGLKYLSISWQQVTGLTRVQLEELLDSSNGLVDIMDFLGIESVAPVSDWSSLPLVDQWEQYCQKVTESIIYDSSVFVTRKPIPDMRVGDIQSLVHKIEDSLRDYNENKRYMLKLRTEFQNVTEQEDKKAELARHREEIEAKQRQLKAEAGLALLGDGARRLSIFGNNTTIEFSGFKKPTEDELINYFALSNPTLLTVEEKEFRQFLKKHKIHIKRGDYIRKIFDKYHPIGESESKFNAFMKELLPGKPVDGYWTSFSSSGDFSLFFFVQWLIKLDIANTLL